MSGCSVDYQEGVFISGGAYPLHICYVNLEYLQGLQKLGERHDGAVALGLYPLAAVAGENEVSGIFREGGPVEFVF